MVYIIILVWITFSVRPSVPYRNSPICPFWCAVYSISSLPYHNRYFVMMVYNYNVLALIASCAAAITQKKATPPSDASKISRNYLWINCDLFCCWAKRMCIVCPGGVIYLFRNRNRFFFCTIFHISEERVLPDRIG